MKGIIKYKIMNEELEQRRVMFRFDNDEPTYLSSKNEGDAFIIELRNGIIQFEKDGKVFCLYIE